MRTKAVAESAVNDYFYEIAPRDLNPHQTMFGGRVMALADSVAAIAAQRHSGKICVTVSVDSLRFLAPAQQGELLIFKAAVNRVWNTSMEVGVKVLAGKYGKKTTRHVVSAYLTFVAVNKKRRPTKIPYRLSPETGEEKRRYRQADERRQYRLRSPGIEPESA